MLNPCRAPCCWFTSPDERPLPPGPAGSASAPPRSAGACLTPRCPCSPALPVRNWGACPAAACSSSDIYKGCTMYESYELVLARVLAISLTLAAMVAEVGGIWYFDITSPNNTVFSVLWPPSIALWGSLVPPYTLVVRLEALQVPEPPVYCKMVDLPVPNVLTMGSPHTKPPPYDFLNLYGACLQAPRTLKMK
jgi:hypothetical protein